MEDLTFDLYYKKEKLAHITVNNNKVQVENYTASKIFNPFLIKNVTKETVIEFLKNRCFEYSRPDKKELLERLGLKEYSIVDIVKKTHGVMAEDHVWIKFEGEDICYEELFDR